MSTAKVQLESPQRMTRVRAQIPIRVRSLGTPEFVEDCHTLVINPQGCGVRLRRDLQAGSRVMLEELPGASQAVAMVASCVPLGNDGKYWLLGLALEEPRNVWCISPAPEDWGEQRQPAASVALPKRADEWAYALFSANGEAHPSKR